MNGICAFCNRKNLEERLIYENGDLYVVATLGQITDGGYILLIAKNHISCFGSMPLELLPEFRNLWMKSRMALYSEYQVPIASFEHGVIGQTIKHAHLHILPARLNFDEKIEKDFPNCRLNNLASFEVFIKYFKVNESPYLLWMNGGIANQRLNICWDPPAPPQYLRLVAAELLGRPERGNWHDMDPKLDKKLCDETVRRLKPYFPKYYM